MSLPVYGESGPALLIFNTDLGIKGLSDTAAGGAYWPCIYSIVVGFASCDII